MRHRWSCVVLRHPTLYKYRRWISIEQPVPAALLLFTAGADDTDILGTHALLQRHPNGFNQTIRPATSACINIFEAMKFSKIILPIIEEFRRNLGSSHQAQDGWAALTSEIRTFGWEGNIRARCEACDILSRRGKSD